jgi:hypothetical protein
MLASKAVSCENLKGHVPTVDPVHTLILADLEVVVLCHTPIVL